MKAHQKTSAAGGSVAGSPLTFKRSPLAVSVTLAMSMMAGSVLAQESSESERSFVIEEVMVTARKRDERMQDVPIAMTAINESVIKDAKVDSVHDIIDVIPSTTFEPGDDGVTANVTIRGVNRTQRTDEPSFGLYRDGVYVGGQISSLPKFLDLASVEVLRGPQGGLYGRNASAGAMIFNSAKPQDDTFGSVGFTIANNDRQEVNAMYNTPLIEDKLLLRAAILYENQDEGFNYNPVLDEELDAEENWAGRVRLKWLVDDSTDVLFTYERTEDSCVACGLAPVITDQEANSSSSFAVAAIPGLGAIDLAEPVVGLDEDGLRKNARNTASYIDSEQDTFIVELNRTVDSGTMTAIGSYRNVEIDGARDNDFSILNDKWDERDIEQESYFMELRFASDSDGPFNYVAGVNYFAEDRTYDSRQLVRIIPGVVGGNFTTGDNAFNIFLRDFVGLPEVVRENLFGPGFGPTGATLENGDPLPFVTEGNGWSGDTGGSFTAFTGNDQELESFAGFIEADYDVTDQLNVWGSLRYTYDKKKLDFEQIDENCDQACHAWWRNVIGLNQVFLADGVTIDTTTSQITNIFKTSRDWESWTPAAGATYVLNDEFTFYGKVTTGFKAGGYNENAALPEDMAINEEDSVGYEIGTNMRLFDNTTTMRLALFLLKRKDAVVAVDDPGFPVGVNLIASSDADIENKGAEFELTSQPIDGLVINASIGYLEAEYESFIGSRDGNTITLDGNTVPLTYKWTGSLQATYRHALPGFDGLDMFYYGLFNTKMDGYLDESNLQEADDQHRLNLKLGVESEDWRVVAFADNVFDEVDIAYQNPREQFRSYTPGRTYGVTFSRDF